jgi:hypothetical protein
MEFVCFYLFIRQNVKGGDRGQFQDTIPALSFSGLRKIRKTSVACVQPEVRAGSLSGNGQVAACMRLPASTHLPLERTGPTTRQVAS